MTPMRSVELVGRVLGDRYRLTRPVGTGASAHVYAADDVTLRRRVAVKVLHPGLAGDEAFGRRFRAEAQAAAGLRHPNILQVYDSGEDDGTPYLVMELLEGGSLRSLLDRGHLLTLSQAARVGADVARALDYAHRRGVVHRDVKPANLIFDDEGRATVADFGLARALAAATWTEPIGGILGTARYAAPEQVCDQALDGRADAYALALVLVEAVTGTVPFASNSAVGTVMARLDRPIDADTVLGPLAAVVAAAGTVDREGRLDAAGMAAALDHAAARLPAPGGLPLAGLPEAGDIGRDDAPTEIPGGRPTPFDIEVIDGPPPPSPYHPVSRALPRSSPPAPAATPSAAEPPAEPRLGRHRVRRRRLVGALVLAASVAVAGAAGALAYLRTRPSPRHPVPLLLHLDTVRASAALAPLHVRLAVTGRSYDTGVPAGQILTQAPPTGTVREGSTVSVTESLGPQPIPVPAGLTGKSQADATTILTTLGLKVGPVTQAFSLAVSAGDVIASSPPAGTLLPGQAVSLTVSVGKPIVAVPSVTASFAAAQSALSAIGLLAGEADQFSDTVPRGQVIATVPPAGTRVRVGTGVTVAVSKGPDVVTVPAVGGLSVTAAAQELANAGLTVTGVSGNPTASAGGTSPAAGTVVHRGAQVTIVTW